MLKRVHLHGPFAAFHDGPVMIHASSAFEAIEAVTMQLPGFKPDLSGPKRIQVVGFPTLESLKQHTDVQDIHIMPVFRFGKQNGLVQTVIGAALLVTAVILAPYVVPYLTQLSTAGIFMMANGLSAMLTPQPKVNEQNRSKYLSGTQNTTAIGTHIGLLYGRFKCGGQLLSLEVISQNT